VENENNIYWKTAMLIAGGIIKLEANIFVFIKGTQRAVCYWFGGEAKEAQAALDRRVEIEKICEQRKRS
jgi:hypothetical protein